MEEQTVSAGAQAPRKKSLFSRLAPVVIVLAGIGAVAAIAMSPGKPKTVSQEGQAPVSVEVVKLAAIADMPDTFDLAGTVQANRVVDVSAEVGAVVEKVATTKGAEVQQGQPLIELNSDLLKADLDRATAQREFDQKEYDRLADLAKKGTATEMELDTANTRVKLSQADLEATTARYKRAKIAAPIHGMLNEVPVEVGTLVGPGVRVAQIVDIEQVKVSVDVPQRDARYLTQGAEQDICEEYFGVPIAKGKITYISALADLQTLTTRIEVTVENPCAELRTGQTVYVRLTRKVIPRAIMIPLEAIIPQEHGYMAFVVEDGLAKACTNIELGPIKGQRVLVTSGLHDGEQLIVRGQRSVSNGQKVEIVTPDAPATQPATSASRPQK